MKPSFTKDRIIAGLIVGLIVQSIINVMQLHTLEEEVMHLTLINEPEDAQTRQIKGLGTIANAFKEQATRGYY